MSWILSKLGATAIVLAMIFCAMMLWIGIPLGWLFIGSQVVDTTQPSMGPYMLVAVGIIGSVIVDAMILGRLNRAYQRSPTARARSTSSCRGCGRCAASASRAAPPGCWT